MQMGPKGKLLNLFLIPKCLDQVRSNRLLLALSHCSIWHFAMKMSATPTIS